jgi:hypothetical protein
MNDNIGPSIRVIEELGIAYNCIPCFLSCLAARARRTVYDALKDRR